MNTWASLFYSRTAALIFALGTVVASYTSAQAPVGKIVIYLEVSSTVAQDVRGDTAHAVEVESNRVASIRDPNGRVPTGVTASAYGFNKRRIWLFDISNQRHATVDYGTYPRVVTENGGQKVKMKRLFDVSNAITASLPFAIIPTYPAPTEQWVYATGSEGMYRHQTAGSETPSTTADDLYAPGISQQPLSTEVVVPEYTLFGLTGYTGAWTGRATERPLTLAASKMKLSLVADLDKAVFPEVLGTNSVELLTEMTSNFGRDRSINFPGYCYSSMTSRISGGRMILAKSLTYRINHTGEGAEAGARTLEGGLTLIRSELSSAGYTEDDFDKWE